MNALNFIAALVDSLVWPVALLALLALLRKEIRSLIPNLSKLRYRELELEFGKRLHELEERVEEQELLPPPDIAATLPSVEGTAEITLPPFDSHGTGVVSSPGVSPVVVRLAPISPRAAIAEAWRGVEHALEDAARRLGQKSGARSSRRIIDSLVEQGLLRRFTPGLIDDLRGLRNQAIHAREIELTAQQALDYADLAARAERMIRLAHEERQ